MKMQNSIEDIDINEDCIKYGNKKFDSNGGVNSYSAIMHIYTSPFSLCAIPIE